MNQIPNTGEYYHNRIYVTLEAESNGRELYGQGLFLQAN
jgi:hypothetical protein